MPDELEPTKSGPPAVTATTVELRQATRVACAILGVASEVFAAIVLWRGNGGAATVAFVVLGAVLIVLAVAGIVPGRIKSGDHEVEMLRRQVAADTQESTDNAIDTMTTEEIESFIQESLRSRNESSVPLVAATRAQEALDFQNSVLLNIRTLFPEVDLRTMQVHRDRGWDAEFTLRDGQVVRLELKWRFSSAAIEQAAAVSNTYGGDAIYWVISHSLSENDRALVRDRYVFRGLRLIISGDTGREMASVLGWLQDPTHAPKPTESIVTF